MRKGFILGILCILLAIALPGLAMAQPAAPADGLELKKTSKVVKFNHSTHAEVKCGECHHPVEGKEDYRACSTAGCHDNFDKKDKSVNAYYQIMHKTKSPKFQTCVSCHQATAGADAAKKKELAGCSKSVCHP